MGLPLVTLAGRIAAVGTVDTLLATAVLLPGRAGSPAESRRACRACRAASGWALAWTVATALAALLTVSRLVGVAPTSLTWEGLRIFVEDTAAGRAAVLVVVLGGLVAVAARRSTGALAAGLLLVLTLSALVAATVWVGGLLALLAIARHARGVPAAGGRRARGLRDHRPGAGPAADPMAGQDHGELSVGVLVDGTRFHVAGPVAAGSRVTVHNHRGGGDAHRGRRVVRRRRARRDADDLPGSSAAG
ncbi:hypothetical protein ABC795_09040 [Blastococcus sp. HT6-30]|uniref:hypothetical protein n=1 Tax=Blastococcus sp. HT6-30 TaxID=3144843 RepID=UPI00321BF658